MFNVALIFTTVGRFQRGQCCKTLYSYCIWALQQFAYLCKLALKIAHLFYSRVVSFWGLCPPQTPHQSFAPGPHWGLRPQRLPPFAPPPRKIFLVTPLTFAISFSVCRTFVQSSIMFVAFNIYSLYVVRVRFYDK